MSDHGPYSDYARLFRFILYDRSHVEMVSLFPRIAHSKIMQRVRH
jgi:hypothetical protein